MGDVSKEEIEELNRVFGKSKGVMYTKSPKEPATILAWNTLPLFAYWGLGAGIAGYALAVKGYNILWTVGPFVPLWVYIIYQWTRQPKQDIENCYKYLLTKRAATCELEKNKKKFHGNEWSKSKEIHEI